MAIPIRQGLRKFRLDVKTGKSTIAVAAILCTYHAAHAQSGATYADERIPEGPIVGCTSTKIDGLADIGRCGCCTGDFAIGAGKAS
jgi:hypothetical protein